jgi:pseudoazurin
MLRNLVAIAFAAALCTVGADRSGAAEFEVKMLNKGAKGAMVFEPDLLKVAPGDIVHFVPTDKTHNAETIKGMIPEGAEGFAGKVNEEVTVTLNVPGVYGIKCKPHYAMGMGALIVVGEPVNRDTAAAMKQTGKAKKAFQALFAAF